MELFISEINDPYGGIIIETDNAGKNTNKKVAVAFQPRQAKITEYTNGQLPTSKGQTLLFSPSQATWKIAYAHNISLFYLLSASIFFVYSGL